jgi:hypothetical protein
MLTPIKTKHTNIMYGAPAGWDAERDGECVALPVAKDAQGVMHSFWQPTETDIANILAGMPIRLSVFSSSHPPVAINITDALD